MLVVYMPEVLWRFISRMEYSIPQILAGAVIIYGGFCMIRGKQEEVRRIQELEETGGMPERRADGEKTQDS